MVLYLKPTLDFSTFPESDGEPMAESVENMTQMGNLMFNFRTLLKAQGRTQVAVGGNQFLYYNRDDGRKHLSPDVYVALDVPPGLRPTWKTWEEGKCPDVVFEISSPSTKDVDLHEKRALYGLLGVWEYYIYDPQLAMQPPLRAYQRVGDRLEEQALLPSGGIFSTLLRAELRPVGEYLRVIDPGTGEPMLLPDDLQDALDAEYAAYRLVEARADAAEARANAAEAALRALRAERRESGAEEPPVAPSN